MICLKVDGKQNYTNRTGRNIMNKETYYSGMLSRHQGIITSEEQENLSKIVVCGAGAGGVGGWAYLSLARLGVRNFKIADPESFDASNSNRQAGSTISNTGRNKAEVIAEMIIEINPLANVQVFSDGLNFENIASFVESGDVILDGIDLYEMKIKKVLFDMARENNLPVISCPVLGFGAAVAVFHPSKSPDFETYFGPVPEKSDKVKFDLYIRRFGMNLFGFKPRLNWPLFTKKVEEGAVPSIGLSCMLSGALASSAIIDWRLQKKQFPIVPVTLHVDLLQHKIVKTGYFKRLFLKSFMSLYFMFIKK